MKSLLRVICHPLIADGKKYSAYLFVAIDFLIFQMQ